MHHQPDIRSDRWYRPNVIAVAAALTLGCAILALPGCASSSSSSSSSSKPEANVSAAPQPGISPDRSLTAAITRVERSSRETLAEIDAGQRNGVQKDWVMTVADNGSFVGHLRIIDVDEHRSTGVISLEQGPGRVRVGQKAIASPQLAGRAPPSTSSADR